MAASWFTEALRKRYCLGNSSISERGISWILGSLDSARSRSSMNSSSSPVRPRSICFFAKFGYLLCQVCVGLGDPAFGIKGENALSLAGCLSGSDRAGNFRVKYPDAAAQCGTQGGDNAFGIVGSPVHHGHKDSVDFQFRIDLPPHSADGADQQIQTLCGKKVRCRRDDHAVGGNQSIDGHQPQGRHAVKVM
nr:MAG TPA: hypothetical protein [Caudoviricetes sp.]